MSPTKESLLQTIEALSAAEAQHAIELIRHLKQESDLDYLYDVLGNNPAFRLPARDNPTLEPVEPAETTGIPASKLLLRDRR